MKYSIRQLIKQPFAAFILLLLVASLGCTSNKDFAGAPGGTLLGGEEAAQNPPQAICFVNPIWKHKANGIFTFTPVPEGLRIVGGLTGLAPGIHALHLHDNADCWAPDAAVVGSRNSFPNNTHGIAPARKRHLGDLGNFAADANGDAKIDFIDPDLTLEGVSSVLGRALIVYEGPDNSTNAPGDTVGDRVGCGIIQWKQNQ